MIATSEQTEKLDFRWLLLSAVILPMAIAAANYAYLRESFVASSINSATALQFAWYVIQVGIVGHVVGSGRAHPLLRWVVFAWILLLVNILTFAAAMGGRGGSCYLLPAALLSGQMGILIVWLVLGDTPALIRVPTMSLGVVAIFALWQAAGSDFWKQMLNELLVLQAITMAILCGILRFQKFRVVRPLRETAGPDEESRKRALQFNLKHVLIWTTGLAMVLGAARALNLLNWQAAQSFMHGILFWKTVLAVVSASCIVVALWVALGQGHWLVRYSVGLLYLLAVGSGVSKWSQHNLTALQTGARRIWLQNDWELNRWYGLGWWWLGWLFLCSGLLASTLLILRALDYRLMRGPRVS
jgi:hypothetical protein